MRPRTRLARLLSFAAVVGGLAGSAVATEVRILKSETREERLQGTLDGLAVDDLGRLTPARRLDSAAVVEEPFVFAATPRPEGGWILGTGASGRILAVSEAGEVATLVQIDSPQVFAVASWKKTVWAAGSPEGPVVRIEGAVAEDLWIPEATYVWDLAVDDRGRLHVATGLPGAVWRVDRDGDAERLWTSPDAHVRSLAIAPDGSVIAGTAGQGRVVRIGRDGSVRALFDGEMPEVVDLAVAADGRIGVALTASEASQVDLSGGGGADDEEGGVTVVAQSGETLGSRAGGYEGPRSRLVELRDGQLPRELMRLEDATAHSLAWWDGAWWVGTGEDGRLWRHDGDRPTLEHDLEARQIVGIVPNGETAAVLATDPGALHLLRAGDSAPTGRFTSRVLDTGSTSRFGTWSASGELDGASVNVRFRAGLGSAPDDTWTDWTPPRSGTTVDASDLGSGRFVQWEAEIGGAGARLGAVELTYRQINAEPRIETFEVLAPGEILVPTSFNPQNQVYEPWSANREGIFERLRPDGATGTNGTKTLYKAGWRTVQWKAEDPNGDTLSYAVSVRPADSEDAPWLPVAEELDQIWLSFDATSLPSGRYRFRLEASDAAVNAPGDGRIVHSESVVAVLDHDGPTLEGVDRAGVAWTVDVGDALSPIRRAELSIDAGGWEPAEPEDALLDETRETLRIRVPEGARYVLLRVVDAAHNTETFDLGGS